MPIDMVIKNGKIVNADGIFQAGVAIDEGKIVLVGSDTSLPQADKTTDAKGNYIMPGAIDPHTHLGLYTPLEGEFESETRAAATGGVTTVMHCPLEKRSYNEALPELNAKAKNRILVNLTFYGAVCTMQQIQEFEDYVKQGLIAFKFFFNRPEYEMFGVVHPDDGMMYLAWEKLGRLGGLPMAHCENFEIARQITEKVKATGKKDLAAWDDARPGFCEYESMVHALNIAKLAKSPIYIVHMTIGDGILVGAEAKRQGVKMYLETTPAYLRFTKHEARIGVLGKVNPPLRTPDDVERLWWGIKAGYIDCIGTDHCASKREKKVGEGDIWSALLGYPGVAERFPAMIDEGFHRRGVSLEKLVEINSYNTARIHGIPNKGVIAPSYDADIIIVDLKKTRKVTPEMLHGVSDFSLYEGLELKGWPIMTICGGTTVMEDGEIVGKPGTGKVVKNQPLLA